MRNTPCPLIKPHTLLLYLFRIATPTIVTVFAHAQHATPHTLFPGADPGFPVRGGAPLPSFRRRAKKKKKGRRRFLGARRVRPP